MEYSFKFSAKANLTIVQLGDYSLSIHDGNLQETIAYANIIQVRINKYPDNTYRIYLIVDDREEIIIPNWSYNENGLKEYQSSAYSLFVRVLHHHLKDKSTAIFKAGRNLNKLWQWAVALAILTFLISVTADYLGIGLLDPYIQSLILTALIMIIIFVFSVNKLPKTYNPSNIPIQFLP